MTKHTDEELNTLVEDLGARLGRGEVIGQTPYAVKCWNAIAAIIQRHRGLLVHLAEVKEHIALAKSDTIGMGDAAYLALDRASNLLDLDGVSAAADRLQAAEARADDCAEALEATEDQLRKANDAISAAEARARTAETDRDEWKSQFDTSERVIAELTNDLAVANITIAKERERARTAEEALKEAADALAIEARANEMSANIMRDGRRTGGWEGAERTAAAFDRHGLKAAGIRAKLLAVLNAKKGSDQ